MKASLLPPGEGYGALSEPGYGEPLPDHPAGNGKVEARFVKGLWGGARPPADVSGGHGHLGFRYCPHPLLSREQTGGLRTFKSSLGENPGSFTFASGIRRRFVV